MLMVYFPAASVATETDQLGAVASGGAVASTESIVLAPAKGLALQKTVPCTLESGTVPAAVGQLPGGQLA